MLWHLLDSLRIPTLYDYSGAGFNRGQVSFAPQDQIDVAGQSNCASLQDIANFARRAVQFINDPEYFADQVLRAPLPDIHEALSRTRTDPKYRAPMRQAVPMERH